MSIPIALFVQFLPMYHQAMDVRRSTTDAGSINLPELVPVWLLLDHFSSCTFRHFDLAPLFMSTSLPHAVHHFSSLSLFSPPSLSLLSLSLSFARIH